MNWFLDGGPAMWAILALDFMGLMLLLVGLGISIGARFVPAMLWPARVIGLLFVLGAASPGCVGAAGWWQGVRMTDQAVEHADPEFADTLRAAGYAMAKTPLWFGLGSAGLVGFLALIPLGIAAVPASARD